MPIRDGPAWTSKSGLLCPLAAGAAVSDHAYALSSSGFVLGPVASPALLLPFAAAIAEVLEQPVAVSWEAGKGTTDGKALGLSGSLPDRSSGVRFAIVDHFVPTAAICKRATPDISVLKVLADFEKRTYAPATEASRLKGAGAGISDND